ncbi:amidohydrolase [Candidatus Aerophobetes bacterium]|nr:amidohydrolase [Candidatus Aerophobetes bacterium]
MNLKKEVTTLVRKIEDKVIKIRRKIHQYPELGFEEIKTAQLVSEELKRLGFEVHSNYGGTTGVVGVIEGNKPGSTQALRADMDALAINEETGLSFSSKIPGQMHACGHDAHTAILLGTAHLLSQLQSQLRGKVVLVFQPAEEGHAGAKTLIDKGLIKEFGIKTMFGHHLWPELPLGVFATKPEVLTGTSDRITIEVQGQSAHAAKPNLGIDSIVIASHLILACQELVSREISPLDSIVITFGSIKSGDAYNIIPKKAVIEGTVRALSSKVQDYVERRLEEIVKGVTATFRAKGKLNYHRVYPSVINHPILTSQVVKWAEEFWGKKKTIRMSNPTLVAEDFSFYSSKIPACFGLLGIGGKSGLHSSHFVLDESILSLGVAWTTYLAIRSSIILHNKLNEHYLIC